MGRPPTRDPELLDRLAVAGKPALMATIVGVEEAFLHCGKATIRSKLWAAPDEAEAERHPIANQIGELLGDQNLVEMVAADLELRPIDPMRDRRWMRRFEYERFNSD